MNKTIDEFGQEIGQDTRKAVRHSVLFLAELSHPGGRSLGQIKVRNISRSGLMAETGLPLNVGDPVEINLRGIGPVRGMVVRRTVKNVSIKFELEIDPQLTRQKI